MNETTDNSLDALIQETMQRRALLTDLDRLIIADVRRQARRARLCRWARIVAFSFGLPLVLLVFVACAYLYIKEQGTTTLSLLIMLWPTLAIVLTTRHAIETFSPDEV